VAESWTMVLREGIGCLLSKAESGKALPTVQELAARTTEKELGEGRATGFAGGEISMPRLFEGAVTRSSGQ